MQRTSSRTSLSDLLRCATKRSHSVPRLRSASHGALVHEFTAGIHGHVPWHRESQGRLMRPGDAEPYDDVDIWVRHELILDDRCDGFLADSFWQARFDDICCDATPDSASWRHCRHSPRLVNWRRSCSQRHVRYACCANRSRNCADPTSTRRFCRARAAVDPSRLRIYGEVRTEVPSWWSWQSCPASPPLTDVV